MLTAERIRACSGEHVLDLFRELGYPIAPVPLDPEEWRRAGIEVPSDRGGQITLAARMRRFDLFWVGRPLQDRDAQLFLASYSKYNVLTKSAIIFSSQLSNHFSIYDLSSSRSLRRLDVDLHDPSPYAVDRLNLLSASGGPMGPVYDLALDRERLTRRFFAAFRDAVRELAHALAVAFPAEARDACSAQAVLVMSRLLFLSFVQERGWLNGERRFLFDRLGKRYYASVIAPLFFGCLNTPRGRRSPAAMRLGRIPYLNGGLFDPSALERRHPHMTVPDSLMRALVREVFERFDFRSDEGDATGVHVDPEMLGKVFESLMAADERAASGSFYTPKQIVDVMTRRAIDTWLGDGDPRRQLDRLSGVTVLDPACGSGAFLLSALAAIEARMRQLGAASGVEFAPSLRRDIVERSLFGVDIKPEAVRLCELRLWLSIVTVMHGEIEALPPLPNLDRNIMQGNSLLSPTDFLGDGRADIYRQWVYGLRAQRDVVTRYRHASGEERPALARIMAANDRRLTADLLARAIESDEMDLQRALVPQRDLFGRVLSPDSERCSELRSRIAGNRAALEDVEEGRLEFFSYDIHFAPVLAAGGFDVVVGNPPWVRNARIPSNLKRMLADRFALFRSGGRSAGFHQPDLSVAFLERSLSLSAAGGVVAMLVPSKLLTAAYATRLRRDLRRYDISSIHDWSGSARRHFDANTFPLGLTIVRRPPHGAIAVQDDSGGYEVDPRDIVFGSEWAIAPPEVLRVLRRLYESHAPLADVLSRRPTMGVKTGDNRAFFLGEGAVRRGSVVTGEGIAVPLRYLARCVRGRDVQRWRAQASEWLLWPPREGWKSPPEWLQRFARARDLDASAFRLSFVRPEHVGVKVAWKDLSRGMAAVVLPDLVSIAGGSVPLVPNQTLYFVDASTIDEAYALSALLNSTVVDALILAVAERAKDAHFRYFGRTIGALPLPKLECGSAEWQRLVRLARRAHRGEDVSAEIDALSARLYGVDERENGVLHGFAARRLERDAC